MEVERSALVPAFGATAPANDMYIVIGRLFGASYRLSEPGHMLAHVPLRMYNGDSARNEFAASLH
ncbi:hypothetical protein P4S95_08285 [Aneurinibacillus aneurinilyticus]|uniref:hypothetical protein n=1 Tax=Aneurinibacillus aneurinilyticus TaxID=1391 RepID=UPI002E201E31|nr:hypothetical protein [Aneurinibacillus aneurinilyticus]